MGGDGAMNGYKRGCGCRDMSGTATSREAGRTGSFIDQPIRDTIVGTTLTVSTSVL